MEKSEDGYERNEMKLYVWCNPYRINYGSTMVFAVANNLREAKKQAANGVEWSYGNLGPGKPRDWSSIKLGDPDRIVDLPCAEWHMWQE